MRVLITGAASGFGRLLMSELNGRGEDVRGLDIQAAPGIHVADVRSQEQVDRGVAAVLEELGGLDVLINNAGVGEPQDAGERPDAAALATIDVNLFGAWRVTAACVPALLESKGRVVNVSSGLAFFNLPFSAAYASSKRGLAAYSDILRIEYGERLGVTTIYPGYVRTPIHGRSEEMGLSLGDYVPEDRIEQVAKAILRACYGRPRRDIATSLLTASGVFFGRHFPALTDAVVRAQMRRLERKGMLPSLSAAAGESARPGV